MVRLDVTRFIGRRPLTELAEAYSGATLETAQLPDGRRVVLKRLAPQGDWLTRATDGEGRLRRMWDGGVFERLGSLLDHTILDVITIDGQDVVVMRDATDDLLPPRVPVSREVSRELLAGLAAMHRGCRGASLERPCPIAARYSMFAPAVLAADTGPGRHPSTDYIMRGWEVFTEHVDGDIADAVSVVHSNPGRLGDRLGGFASTLLHGDAKLANLGRSDGRLVAIDWADLTGLGPPEIDVAWYALKGCDRIGCTPDEVFADYEAMGGARLDEEALDLVCIGSLAQMGFSFAMGAFGSQEPLPVAARLLNWWVSRVRAALERIGPI